MNKKTIRVKLSLTSIFVVKRFNGMPKIFYFTYASSTTAGSLASRMMALCTEVLFFYQNSPLILHVQDLINLIYTIPFTDIQQAFTNSLCDNQIVSQLWLTMIMHKVTMHNAWKERKGLQLIRNETCSADKSKILKLIRYPFLKRNNMIFQFSLTLNKLWVCY